MRACAAASASRSHSCHGRYNPAPEGIYRHRPTWCELTRLRPERRKPDGDGTFAPIGRWPNRNVPRRRAIMYPLASIAGGFLATLGILSVAVSGPTTLSQMSAGLTTPATNATAEFDRSHKG